MHAKPFMCFSRILRVCISSNLRNESPVATLLSLRSTQRSISTGAHTHGLFSSSSSCQPATRPPHLFHHNLNHLRLLRPPHLTQQTASFISEVDVSTIPKHDAEKGRLVYVGTMAKLVKLVKAFSVSTSMLGVCVQPYLYAHAHDQPMALTLAVGGMLSFFVFLTPLLLHFVTKRYVTKLYYDENTRVFTATNYTFFVLEKDTRFTAEDVKFPEIPGLFTTLKVAGNPMFIDSSLFLEREAYVLLMGYDKPIEWKMPDYEKEEKK